jgi:hypothetical protein
MEKGKILLVWSERSESDLDSEVTVPVKLQKSPEVDASAFLPCKRKLCWYHDLVDFQQVLQVWLQIQSSV